MTDNVVNIAAASRKPTANAGDIPAFLKRDASATEKPTAPAAKPTESKPAAKPVASAKPAAKPTTAKQPATTKPAANTKPAKPPATVTVAELARELGITGLKARTRIRTYESEIPSGYRVDDGAGSNRHVFHGKHRAWLISFLTDSRARGRPATKAKPAAKQPAKPTGKRKR